MISDKAFNIINRRVATKNTRFSILKISKKVVKMKKNLKLSILHIYKEMAQISKLLSKSFIKKRICDKIYQA